jgi:hypothetical protein
VIAGTCAVVGLSVACYLMVNETRLAVSSLEAEARMRIRMSDSSKTD